MGFKSQFDLTTRCTRAGPGPILYVIGSAPRHELGATVPPIAASNGNASPYEMGSTGIFVSVGASFIGSRFAFFVAPTPGVRGSPGYVGMSITLPRWTPSAGRRGPLGKTSPRL